MYYFAFMQATLIILLQQGNIYRLQETIDIVTTTTAKEWLHIIGSSQYHNKKHGGLSSPSSCVYGNTAPSSVCEDLHIQYLHSEVV